MSFASLPWPFRRRQVAASRTSDCSAEAGRLLEFGVTSELLEFASSLTADAFRSFAARLTQEDGSKAGTVDVDGNVRTDLTEWQEQHAVLVLSKSKHISRIRYDLCPRYMKDGQFWTIYFLLVSNYVAPYEQSAIRKAMLARKAENQETKTGTIIEVEMQESKYKDFSSSSRPIS